MKFSSPIYYFNYKICEMSSPPPPLNTYGVLITLVGKEGNLSIAHLTHYRLGSFKKLHLCVKMNKLTHIYDFIQKCDLPDGS